eukprot:GSMAST32.ASY1.ANO1.1160.1 assembled CDS
MLSKSPAPSNPPSPCLPKKTILVIDGGETNWIAIFASSRTLMVSGKNHEIIIEQCGWSDISLTSSCEKGASPSVLVHIRVRSKNGPRFDSRKLIKPDFVLVRNEVRGVGAGTDWRKILYGFMYSQVPSLNSWESIIMFCERPISHASLLTIRSRLGEDVFPVIPQSYYENHGNMMWWEDFPVVCKIGHGQAGYGKIKIENKNRFDDVKSILATTNQYCTVEPFINGAFDLRIQRIGLDDSKCHYRVFQRRSVSGNWKTNVGASVIEEIEMNERYKLWVDEAAKCFGGLTIVTVDAIHCEETGKEFILEMNGTSSGLMPECAAEDNGYIKDEVLNIAKKAWEK